MITELARNWQHQPLKILTTLLQKSHKIIRQISQHYHKNNFNKNKYAHKLFRNIIKTHLEFSQFPQNSQTILTKLSQKSHKNITTITKLTHKTHKK